MKHDTFITWGALLGSAIGAGAGVLLALVVSDNDPLGLGLGIGVFPGFCVGAMVADKLFWSLERYRAEIVREASLEAKKQAVEASKLPDWWPTDDELAASLNPRQSQDDEPAVTIIVPSPRRKPKRQKP